MPGRNTLPFGLFGAAVMVVAAEWGAFRALDALAYAPASWRDAERAAAVGAGEFDGAVLCLGDSQVKCALLPALMEERLGRPVANLAVIGGQAASSYYLLDRVLSAGRRPRAVVVDFFPLLLVNDPQANLRQWPELLRPGEYLELIVATRSARLVGPLLVRAALPSLRARVEVRAAARAAWRGETDRARELTLAFRRNWSLNRGAHLMALDHAEGSAQIGAAALALGTAWRCKPVHAQYIRRFFNHAARHGVQVVWLLPTIAPSRRDEWARSGLDQAHDRFVRQLQAEHPEVIVVDPSPALTEASLFADPNHVNADGAVRLSAALAETLGPVLSGREHPNRLALAPAAATVETTAAGLGLEDLSRSIAVVRSRTGVGSVAPPSLAAGTSATSRR